jgi:hypothetical protein
MLDPDSTALRTLSSVVIKLTDELVAREGVLQLTEETDCHSEDSHDDRRILILPLLGCPPNSSPNIVSTTELVAKIDDAILIELVTFKRYSR